MHDTRFFPPALAMSVGAIGALAGARLARGDPEQLIVGAAPLETAQPGEITFLDNPKYLKLLGATEAAACFCQSRHIEHVPPHVAVLESAEPYRAYSIYLAAAYPAAMRPAGFLEGQGGVHQGTIHPEAQLEAGVRVEPGAVVGPRAEIGGGTVVAAGAAIGPGVAIGRDCYVGASASLQSCLIGNRVIIHPGARIGQDGFGFAMGARGHLKIAQIGRVIIQDDVEIGANTAIDRGGNRDTVIGEGTKIDNLVQIGHNAEIGRHCVIVAQTAIAGSVRVGDFVVIGGQVAVAGHLTVGDGAQIAGQSGVTRDVPPGGRVGGYPARPMKVWAEEVAAIRRMAKSIREK